MTDESTNSEVSETASDSSPTSASEMSGLISRLEVDLGESRAANDMSRKVGVALVLIIGLYLSWVTLQVNRMSEPKELALAAAGAAIEATPVIGTHLRTVVVDGAPDIARLASTSVVDMIPVYREAAEAELVPLIDEVSEVLAQTAMSQMAASIEAGETPISEQQALQAGADAAVARLETVLEEAMDEPTENDGPTPRQTINATLRQLQVLDRGLRKVAQKKGDPKERELILSWLSLIASQTETAEQSAREAYRVQSQRAAEAAAPAETEAGAETEAAVKGGAPAQDQAPAETPAGK